MSNPMFDFCAYFVEYKVKFKENLVVLQCVAIASISPIVVAEKVDGDRLETVVVVGSTTNVDISSDDMQRRQANDLDDVFRLTPSVTVGGSVGIAQKVYIRGLEDTLLNVTVDGAPFIINMNFIKL